MKAGRLELLTGILIGSLPFLGLPSHSFKIILPIIGIFILYNTYKKYPLGQSGLDKNTLPTFNPENKAREHRAITAVDDTSQKTKASPEHKRTLQHIPIVTKDVSASSQETSAGNRKHLLLALQMLGYRQKQNLETSRLATRINVEKNKALLDLQEIEADLPEEETEALPQETLTDIETSEELEVIIDEELLLDEETTDTESLTPHALQEKPVVTTAEEPPTDEEDGEYGPLEEDPEEDPLEFFSINNHAKMDLDFLSRIGDEIEE